MMYDGTHRVGEGRREGKEVEAEESQSSASHSPTKKNGHLWKLVSGGYTRLHHNPGSR